MTQPSQSTVMPRDAGARKAKAWQKLLPFLITLACFAYLYNRLNHAAVAEGTSLLTYLAKSFESVNWLYWLALMIPYCCLYVIFDSLMIWTVINWFNAKIRYADILPIRASAYILSLVNEQVSKGAIALYLNRRDGVPGWEVGSSMLLVTFCEIYSLILWATAGVLLRWNSFPAAFHVIPWIALGAAVFFVLVHSFFSGKIAPRAALRDRPIVAIDRVRFAGEPVAVVAAEDEVTAAAALRLIEVEYAELTADDQLRQTTFLGWRDDKKAKEVVLEQPRTGLPERHL